MTFWTICPKIIKHHSSRKGEYKLDHSVRAYLERITVDKLQLILDSESFDNTDAMGDAILQDLLETMIARNDKENGIWTEYIRKIQINKTN